MKLVGERRALSAAVLAFFFLNFLLAGFSPDIPEELHKAMFALAGSYGLAFFSLVAGYFWARWYSVGIGLFGVIVAVVMTWQLKALVPEMMFFGGMHLFVAIGLWGQAMAEPFDGQQGWRQRFHMDDSAVQRLGRSVIRAGVMLPFILVYAFGPRPDAFSLGTLALAVFGFRGLVQLKTWGIVAMGLAGAMLLVGPTHTMVIDHYTVSLPAWPIALLLFASVAPFAKPMARFARAR